MDPLSTAAVASTAIGVGKDVMRVGIQGAKALASAYGKRSISRLAKDAIFQFPSMFSADIDTDDIVVLARSYEREYASFVVAAMSLDNNVNLQKYANMRDYLKTFHNNGNIPSAIYNGGSVIFESASIAAEGSVYVDPKVIRSLWTCSMEQYDLEILNNIYRPFDYTARKIGDRIALAQEAQGKTEEDYKLEYKYKKKFEEEKAARNKLEKEADRAAQQADKARERDQKMNEPDRAAYFTSKTNADGVGAYNAAMSDKINEAKKEFYDKHPNLQKGKNIASGYVKKNNPIYHYGNGGGASSKIDGQREKFDTMAPTIVNITVTNYTGSTTWNQTLTLGVKTMIRLIPSGQMVANMIEAAKDRAIFKFIKWTKGEYKLTDMLFGKSKYKKLGIENARGKWLAALKKRATIDNISKFFGARLLPNATIVITENEAVQIKDATGLDLHNVGVIKKIMDKYFLLGFGIYDTETRILSSMIDGDTAYSQYPMRALVSGIKKEVDLLNAASGKRF